MKRQTAYAHFGSDTKGPFETQEARLNADSTKVLVHGIWRKVHKDGMGFYVKYTGEFDDKLRVSL